MLKSNLLINLFNFLNPQFYATKMISVMLNHNKNSNLLSLKLFMIRIKMFKNAPPCACTAMMI